MGGGGGGGGGVGVGGGGGLRGPLIGPGVFLQLYTDHVHCTLQVEG